ncbi:RNA-guided endonuclease InsQ/TnpB family protein [Methanobrevibacter sp.]|uniref:RNA-guided endonuclease InsQ/TnpB family protein n=1 Tax=Methanobrevibacter sp. TaxID=66852 RepID=UPI003864710B
MSDVLTCKCRINPNWDMEVAFWDAFGASRFVSNNVRQEVRQARIHNKIIDKNHLESRDEKIKINRSFYNDCLRELKHENPFLYEIDSTALQDSIERLQKAYQRYDKRLSGEPKIKTLKNPVQSFTIKNVNNSIRIKDNYIRLNKYGFIKLRGLRPIIGRIQTVTIIYDKGRWYASITYRLEIQIDPLPLTGKSVGIDVGLKNYITLSTGEVIAKPDTSDLDDKIKKQRKIISLIF